METNFTYKIKSSEIAKSTLECSKIAFDWTSSRKDGQVLGYYKNKRDDFLVALYSYGAIYLLGGPYKTPIMAPKLFFHISGEDSVFIDDVLTKSNSVGNGSILLESLIEYCKLNHINKIFGHLSSVDDDHKQRRDNFYKKFGFIFKKNTIIKTIEL